MPCEILFITRTWHGTGGMQRLSRDLWRAMSEWKEDRAALCIPHSSGRCALIPFALRAMWYGWRTLRHGGTVHLGDASLSILIPLLRFTKRGRITITACGLDVIYTDRFYQWMIHRTLPRADCVCPISRATANEVQKRGVAASKLVVIPCGIREAPLSVPEHAPENVTLLTIGRLIPRKGVTWFLSEVLPPLLRRNHAIHYCIVGSGDQELLIKKFIQEKGLQDDVSLHSQCSDSERNELLKRATLCVIPNISVSDDMEGFGIVCIEASASGVPVVAARIEGLKDAVIENETGLFFESGNVDGCIRAIERMITSPPDRSAVARATLKHFHWSVLFPRYIHEVFTA
ncbi:glycosyltransferase family 4 protein [Candidatus Peregrinibacteria bacterium]|nr:glycosyltransferase family 4 protein [Candidatus Peregrinibacteria bacterium]